METTTSTRVTLVSADCHAGAAAMADYEPYIPAQHRDAYREYLASIDAFEAARDAENAARGMPARNAHGGAFAREEADQALWDMELRRRHLEADGVVGEVLFPQGSVPFAPYPAVGGSGSIDWKATVEQRNIGPEIYNRWLADFCSVDPDVHYGVAVVPIRDIDAAAAEVARAKEFGINGGISLPPVGDDFALYNDRSYDRLWAACQDHDMVINIHGGAGKTYGKGADGSALVLAETDFFSRRALWFLIFSGVFERFPRLHMAITEQRAHWAGPLLRDLDSIYRWTRMEALRNELPRPPSEYFATNCWVGASFMSKPECDMRDETGVDRLMWGSDYPHTEGTWPWVTTSLRWTFDDVDETELRQMVGGNAIDCYGFDAGLLQRRAAEIGPTVADITASPLGSPPSDPGVELTWAFRTATWS